MPAPNLKTGTRPIVPFLFVLLTALLLAQQPNPEELQHKASAGDAVAERELGRRYAEGTGVTQDDAQAVNWYRKAADQGDAAAQTALGVMYSLGRGVQKDYVEAFNWYMKAASQGYGPALYNVAAAYYNGDGTGRDDFKSYAYFVLAQRVGDKLAEEAVARAEKDLGPYSLSRAKFELINILASATWLPTRAQDMIAVYRDLANSGNNFARLRLARMYLQEGPAVKNATEAERLCQAAAKSGYVPGMVCLGYLYQSSELGAPRYKDALSWYQRASESGNPVAFYSLAALYGNGEGVKQDKMKAFTYLLLAAHQGLSMAEQIEALRTKLDPETGAEGAQGGNKTSALLSAWIWRPGE